MTTRIALISLVALVSACNSPGFIKKSDGDSIKVESAAFVPAMDNNGNIVSATLLLSDSPEICRSLRSGRMPKKSEGLSITLLRGNNNGLLAPDTGEYTVITSEPQRAGAYAVGGFFKFDLNCRNTLPDTDAAMKSGFIDIDQLETGRDGIISGTLDVTYGRGEDAQGRFTAEYCELSAPQLNCQ